MIRTYRQAIVVYTLVVLVMIWPVWVQGAIVAPTCHAQINGMQYVTPAMQACEHRKLADYEEEFLPEIANQLTLPHTGFLVTRNEYTELGRPAKHLTGNTPANVYTWIHYQLSKDPYRILTNLALSQWWLLGVFVLLLCQLWGMDARAGWVAALSAVSTPFVVYWLSFPMHVASLCWGAGLLYGCTRLMHQPDRWGWLITAFSMYSLILMGYPQTAVYSLWMVGGVVCIECMPLVRTRAWGGLRWRLGALLSAGVVGVVLCTPVLWDAYERYRDSQRYWIDDEFFMQSAQHINTITAAWLYLVSRTVPEIFGNPIATDYAYEFDGASWSLLSLGFVVAAVRWRWRESRYWVVLSAGLVLLTTVPPLLVLLIHVPGFRLSAWTPLWSAVLPVAFCVGWGCDAVMRATQIPIKWVIWTSLGGVGLVALGVGVTRVYQTVIDWWHVGMVLGVVMAWGWVVYRRTPMALVVGLLVSIWVTATPLLLLRAPQEMIRTTPLTRVLQRELADGSRYAIISGQLGHLLSPNYNALLGVASVHAYNNFYPPAYTTLIHQLGGKITVYGKLNKFVTPDPQGMMFWMSNIAVVLNDQPIDTPNLTLVTVDHGVYVYQVQQRMGMTWRIAMPTVLAVQDVRVPEYHTRPPLAVTLVRDQGDTVEYDVAASATSSLLMRSTLYEPNWQAQIRRPDNVWVPTRVYSVNGVFLAAHIPAHATGVRFVYHTAVQHMWISHVLWGILGLVGMVWKGTSMEGIGRRTNIDGGDREKKEHRWRGWRG